jgi:hypothetical protein
MGDENKRQKWPRDVVVGNARVKVYRVRHKTNASGWTYVLAWQTPAGRKREKFADETEALREARTKAGQIDTGRIEGATMSVGDRDELQAARLLAGSTPILAALHEWASGRDITDGNVLPACEAWAARNSTRFERIAVQEAIKRFTDAKRRAGVDVTCSYDKILPSLKEHAGDRMLDAISARELQAWLDTRYPHPVSR